MKQNYEKSCGAVIFRQAPELEVLIIRQNQGHWCFPKGHVEGNEDETETARREVKEETGLDIRFLGGFREETHYSPREGVEKDVVYIRRFKACGKNPACFFYIKKRPAYPQAFIHLFIFFCPRRLW